MVFLHCWTDSWDLSLFPLCLMSDAANERVKAEVWTGKNNKFFRVTTLSTAVCCTSKICENWQISVEAALYLAAHPRNPCLAALTPSHRFSHHRWHSGKPTKGCVSCQGSVWNWCGWDSPLHCCVQTPGANHACGWRGLFFLHIGEAGVVQTIANQECLHKRQRLWNTWACEQWGQN